MCTFVWLLGENRSTISIRHTGISRRVGRLKCWWVHLKWRWMCTSHINLVGFYPVLLQLMLLICIQQPSINTQVNTSTSTRGQHVCVSLLLTRGRHYARRAIRWALPCISSYTIILVGKPAICNNACNNCTRNDVLRLLTSHVATCTIVVLHVGLHEHVNHWGGWLLTASTACSISSDRINPGRNEISWTSSGGVSM